MLAPHTWAMTKGRKGGAIEEGESEHTQCQLTKDERLVTMAWEAEIKGAVGVIAATSDEVENRED